MAHVGRAKTAFTRARLYGREKNEQVGYHAPYGQDRKESLSSIPLCSGNREGGSAPYILRRGVSATTPCVSGKVRMFRIPHREKRSVSIRTPYMGEKKKKKASKLAMLRRENVEF